MKNHYLITQIADVLIQLYECVIKDIKVIKRTLEKISEGLLECLKKQQLQDDDMKFKKIQIRKNIA